MNVDGSYVIRRAYGVYQPCLIVRADERHLWVVGLNPGREPKGRQRLLVRSGALGIFASYEEAVSRAENANTVEREYRVQIDATREALRSVHLERDEAVQAALHPAET
jgi:hypothetical protein